MKHFSSSNPIVKFSVRCPQDGTVHQALAKAYWNYDKSPELVSVECHQSSGCKPCKDCIGKIWKAFQTNKEPDDFFTPLDPLLLPDWKE